MYYFKTLSFRVIVLIGFLLSCLAGEAQVKKTFAIRDQRTLKGDMTMIANSIVNRYEPVRDKMDWVWRNGRWRWEVVGTLPETPTSTPYDGSANNDNFTMRYIDADTDPLTFSSSKATLAIPDAPACSKIVYAALYWSGTYLYNGSDSSTGRESTTFHQVKLKLPTEAAYTDITGTVIYDDETSGSATFANRPYACYANVTSLLAGQTNPNGEYTVANIRATQAGLTGGISAGWTLYIVYENPKSAGRYITSYDGFAGVSQSQAGVDLNYTGFVTVPQKVQAKLIVSALEGDKGIDGDNLKFRSGPTGTFNDISNAQNAADNFFNGTVSVLNASGTSVNFDDRVPNSLNTLGYDSDIVNISSQLQPSATEATLRITSTGDTYYMFFNAFSVDVIAPDLQLVKTVERFGQDAAGANVDLGDPLDYILTFKNIGNDDGKDLVITDILPKNTIYVGSTRPTGVAAPTINAVTGALEFTIPNELVKKGTESIESVIRIHVKVASTCSEFTDACSNEIRNKAFASYTGVINTMPILDGSVTGLDQNNCMKPIEGPANFIVGLATCDFLHNEVLCGPSLLLKTGSGYATYQWYRKDPAGDIALPGETGQQMTVFVPGEYYVRCIPAAPCLTELLETFIVKLHANSLQNNPIKPFQDKEVKCNDTGEILPVIILCGLNDHKMIQTGITGVTSIVWEKLTGACYDPTAVCINKSATCTWVNVGTGPDYDANEAGTFRMRISYAGGTGCVTSYYFKVSKNLLNPQINTTNIFCTQDGEIKVVNVPTTYEIKLINQTTGTTIVDYPNTTQVFAITASGVYRVELRHQGVADGCEFILPNIGISKKELEVEFVTENQTCNGLGSIRIKPTDVQSQYQYTISGPVNDTRAPSTNRNVIFEGLISGVYTVTVTTTNGCTITDTVTILDHSNLSVSGTVTQNISCVPGTIKLTGSGGEPTYLYAVHSYTGPAVTPPALNVFSDAAVFEIPEAQAGTYVFAMKDANGCTALTAPITISVMPGVVYTTAFKNVSCNGANDGSITYTVTATNGYTVSYELLNAAGDLVEMNNLGKFINLAAGTYTVNLVQTGTGNIPCPFPTTFTISEPAALAGTASLTQAYTCTTNGVITVNVPSVTGGTSPYEYSIGGAFGATSTFTGLTPGNYTVKVKDAKGCILTMPVINIPVLPKMTDLTFTPTAVTCPTVTANVTVAVTGGVGPFQYAITAPASAVTPIGASATFAGLAPGTYTFTATDANNCTFSKDYTINTITKIKVIGALVKSVVCFGEANGSLKYTVSGSTNYNYSVVSSGTAIAPATNQSAPVININNLLAGTYTITVKDNVTNCEFSDTVIIDAPTAALTVSHTVVEPSCTAPGSITVTAANGWGNYMYQLNAGTPQSNNVFNNVAAGTYTITVVDANGCVKTDTATLTTPLAPVINITGSDLCFDADGTTVTVNTTGGRLPFSYILNSGAGQTGNTFTDLVPGTYNVMVKDANNCLTAPLNFTVFPALKLDISQKELDCSGSPDAEINIAITGGKAPFTYETKIGSNPYGTSATVAASTVNYSTAAAGIYKFRITDAAGCSIETNAIEVLPLSMPAITSLTPTAVVCHGESNGSIAVVVNTAVGTPAYTITVENTTTGDNFTRTTNLPAGMYTVTVTDGKGCPITGTTEITEPDAITFTTLETPIQCTVVDPLDPTVNITAGKIRIENVAGGFEPVVGTPGPYTYYLKNNFGYEATPVTTSDTFHEFIVLNFGIYEVTVEDANGCKVIKSNIIMASPPEEMDIDIAAVVADCATGGTAVVEVKPDVSSDNYSFAILTTNDPNNIPASDYLPADAGTPKIHTFNGLIPGLTYTFIVKDNATGCYYIKEALVPIPTLSNLVIVKDIISNVTCTNADDGTAKFTFSGFDAGATDISYEVYYAQSNIPVTPIVPPALPPSVPVAAGEVSVSGLAPGIYFILFKEIGGIHDGCSVVSEQFTISESLKLLVPSAVVTKNDNCKPKAGIITASANHGTGPYTYELKLATDTAPTTATWAGTNVNTFTADGGNYIVYVKDANNCIKPAAITLPTDPSPIITTTVTNQCNTAEGAFTISVNMTQAGMPPYTYSIDGGAFVSQATMPFTYTNLSSGNHTVTVKDGNGCTFSPVAPAAIYAPLDLTSVVTTQPWCAISNGEIKITGFGGSGVYRYELKNAADVTIAGPQILNTFGGMAPGTYKVIIRDFNTGCFKEGSITLETPTPVTFNATKQDVSCKGGNDGAITITLPASNDNPQYTYLVSKGGVAVTQSGPIFTGLTEGVYDIRVLSGRVCDALGTVTISAPNALTVTATATAFACNPDNTVKTSLVTITEAGGVTPYWYSINGTDYFETNTFNVIDDGTVQNITAYVKDKNNCESTVPVIINPLPALGTAIATKVTGITCTNDETVKVDITGGSGNFKFELLPAGASVSPGAGIRTANFTLTAVGSYTFKVTDLTTGCSVITLPYEILPYNTITAAVSNAVPVVCHGASDGKITLNVANYTGTYSYKVFNDLGTQVGTGTSTAPNTFEITGLPAGVLHVEVEATQTPFCTINTTTITVPSPADALVVNATANASVTCDNNKGVIIAESTGGWGTYEYEFINATTSTQLQPYGVNNLWGDLAAGTYTINVKDIGGCVATTNVTLNPAVRIVADILANPTLLACNGDNNATVKATNVANGSGVYQYILNEYDSLTAVTPVSSSGAQLNDTFTGLGAGIYSITVTDGWNCNVETVKVTIDEPEILRGALSVTKQLECIAKAELTLTVTGGTQPYSYKSISDAVYTVMGSDTVTISNLSDGIYQYNIIDGNGCAMVMSNQITLEPVPTLELEVTNTIVNCSGATTAEIEGEATGGLGSYKYALLADAAGTVELVGDQDSGVFPGLGHGTYYVRVKSKDCSVTSAAITIADPDLLEVTYDLHPVKCFGETTGRIVIHTTGGTGIIQYAISPDLSQFENNNELTGLKAGLYTVLVQDANGCFVLLRDLEITQPLLVEADIDMTATNGERCLGANDGAIAIDIRGGMGVYEVSIEHSAGASTPTAPFTLIPGSHYVFEHLTPGDKTIFIRDTNGCAVDPPLEFTITEGVDIKPTTAVTQVCTGNTPSSTLVISIDAAITATDVEYSIDGTNYQASNTFTNVAPGIDKIAYAKHVNGCIQQALYTIETLAPITATALPTAVLCKSGATGKITVTASGGTGTLEYSISDAVPPVFAAYNTNNVFTGLVKGTYAVSVKDSIGCELQIIDIIVDEPVDVLTATSVPTHEICINAADGTILVTPAGGTGPYFISLNGGTEVNAAVSHTFIDLADGTYTIDVRDTNNCVTTQQSVTINPGVDLQIVATPVETCTGNVPSTVVTVTVNAAVAADVQYSFDGAAYTATNSFTYANTAGGAKTVDVKHTNGCIQTVPFAINNLTPITATAATTQDVLCNAGATGEVTVTATAGTGTLQYAISSATPPVFTAYDTNNVFTGLTAGTYTVSVKDGIGCEVVIPGVIVNEPAQALSATAVPTHEICINAADGTILVTPAGGTGPYFISLNGGTEVNAAVSHTFTALADGTYTIDVRDTNNCTITQQSVTIDPGVDIQAVATPVETCTGNLPSTVVTVTVNAAVAADVQYSFDGAAYTATNSFTYANTAGGAKTVNVKHTNGCIQTVPFTINNLTPITANAATTQDVLCNAGATGEVTVTATAGTGTLQYAISSATPPVFTAYDTNNVFTGLTAGTYTVSVKDGIGCEVVIPGVIVNEPALALSATSVPTHEICINAADGTILVTPAGGTGPYFISLNGAAEVNAAVSHTFTALADGTYTIDVRDTNNCVTTQQSVTINPGVDLQIVATPVETCTGNVPSTVVTVTVNAAVAADVQYSFDGAAYTATNSFTYASTAGGAKTVDVKHTNGCIQTVPFAINNLTPITATAATTQDVLCNAGATGEVTVTATAGTGTLQYAISSATPPVFTAYDTNNVFTGLTAGTYTVSVKDGIGCEVVIPGVIVNEPAQALSATAVPTHEICINAADGTILVTPAGGTGPYFISLNGGTEVNAAVSHTFTALADGTYTIDVRDTNNCTITQQSVTIDPGVDIQAVATPVETCTGNVPSTVVTVTVNAAVAADVQYSFDGAAYTATNSFTYANTAGGAKTVNVKHTNGCIQTVPFTINNLTPITANAATTQDVLCNAGATGEVTVTATAGTGTLQYAISSATPPVFTAYDTNNVFTGLTAGTYTVSVKDGIGCEVVIPGVIVNEPALALSATAVPTHEICINAADGTILVTPAGGTGPYFISLNGGTEVNAAVSHTFIDLADGTYTIDVRDTNNCVTTQQSVTINPGVDLQIVATPVETCTGNVPSTVVTVTVNAAVAADVQYSFDGAAYTATNSFTYANTAGGAKTVDVKHTNGCIQTVPFAINNLTPITATAATTQDVLCNAGATGEVTVTATAGTGTLQYAISSATPPVFTAYDTNNVFTGLTAGTYTVSVKDGIGCEVVIPGVIVNEPAQALSATAVPTHEICINAADGTILVTPAGGTGPYFISLNGGTEVNAAVSHTFTALADGTYTIDVRDTNNCTITQQSVTIDPGVDIQAVATPVETCTGNLPSTVVTVTVNAAVAADVQYSFDGAAYTATNSFTYANTAGGAKTVNVKHTNGCIQTVPFTINNLTPITANAATTQDVLCNAGATGEVTVTATAGTGTLQYAISSATPPVFTAYDTNNVFTGLTAGTYTVSVKDGIGCEVVIPGVIVNEPAQALTATAVPTHEICINAADGTILVTPAGGTGPYFISLNGGTEVNAAVSHTFTALADGTYTIDVRDTNNCTVTQQTVTINPGVDIQAVATPVETCTGNVPSTVVTVTVNAAVAADVQYSFDGAAYTATNSFTYANTAGGAKTVNVKHTNGCIQTVPFTINNLTPIGGTASTTANVLCFGSTTGEVTVAATGGTGAFQYAISPNNVYQPSNVFTGLVAGTYTVKVKDAIGCEFVINTILVDGPTAALAATAAATPETCINVNDGTITITPSGGTAPYFTSIDGVAYTQDKVLYTGLADGTYTVYVKDVNDCAVAPQTVTVIPGVAIQPTVTVSRVCDLSTVTISVNPAVAGNVTYYIDSVLTSTPVTKVFTPGVHTVDVEHVNGCIERTTFTIDPIVPITIGTPILHDIACYGMSTGSIEVIATGGNGPLQYALYHLSDYQNGGPALYPYSTANTFVVPVGLYVAKVRDAIGCETVSQNMEIKEPLTPLSATVTPVPETCILAKDGKVQISNISGGTPPYSIALNTQTENNFIQLQGNSHEFTGLYGGIYDVFIRDANGCYLPKFTRTVKNGVNMQPYVTTEVSCNNNIQTTTVTVNVIATPTNEVTFSETGNSGTFTANNVFSYTTPGDYVVYVLHVNGCKASVKFTVAPRVPIVPVATAVAVLCKGEANGSIKVSATGGIGALQYGIAPNYTMTSNPVFSGLAAGDHIVRVQDTAGCYTDITVKVEEPVTALTVQLEKIWQEEICADDDNGALEVNVTGGTAPYFTSLDANGVFTEGEYLFDNLDGGVTYTVYVKDANGCITSIDVPLAAPINIDAKADVAYGCDGNNTITVTTSGVFVPTDLTHTISGAKTGTPQTSNIFTNLADGEYTVEVLHASGCSDSVTFTIDNPLPLTVTLAETGFNQITASASGGSGSHSYSITFNSEEVTTNRTYTYFKSGKYVVTVTDNRGCEAIAEINVVFVEINIPDIVTPDNDGHNDGWKPNNTQNYPKLTADVFDRYGRKLASLREGQAWDCKYEGNEMPSGDYWYLVKLNADQDSREFIGHFTIYR